MARFVFIFFRKIKNPAFLILLASCSANSLPAQDYPFKINKYNFVQYDKNVIYYESNALEAYNELFQKFSEMILKGQSQIRIVHIGDSHIQADYFSGRFRTRLQTFDKGLQGSRGFIFPYRVAKTNNPPSYKVTYNGNWTSCRNVERNKDCLLGLSGISVSTTDTVVSLDFSLSRKGYLPTDFNKIKIFYNFWEAPYAVDFTNGQIEKPVIKSYPAQGYVEFSFSEYLDSVTITFTRLDSIPVPLTLYGFSFENENPGIVYSTVGVNGADSRSFLRCKLFEPQLQALQPDWIIISLGTNDVYSRRFSRDDFFANMDTLIRDIKEAAPGVPILLTTPGDHFRRRRYLNYDVPTARQVIFALAKKHNLAVWDLYEVMGGLNSIRQWHYAGLTANDYLHFNKNGYLLQGDLIFNAFLTAFDKYIDENKKTSTTTP